MDCRSSRGRARRVVRGLARGGDTLVEETIRRD